MDLVITFLIGVVSGICVAKLWFIDSGDQKGCAGHVAPNKPIPNFTPPKPSRFTKVNLDRYGNEIDVGESTQKRWYKEIAEYGMIPTKKNGKIYWNSSTQQQQVVIFLITSKGPSI